MEKTAAPQPARQSERAGSTLGFPFLLPSAPTGASHHPPPPLRLLPPSEGS